MKEEKNNPSVLTGELENLLISSGRVSDIQVIRRGLDKLAREDSRFFEAIQSVFEGLLREKESAGHYSSLFDLAPSGFLTLNRSGIIGDINICAAGLFGIDQEIMKGKPLHDYINPIHFLRFEDFLEAVFSYKGTETCELAISPEANSGAQIQVAGIAIKESGVCLIAITDNSSQKKTEDLLQNNEERLKTLFELAVDAILIGNPEGIIIRANQSAAELTGYNQNELIGQSISILFAEEELHRIPFQYEKLKQGLIIRRERYLSRKDGSKVPVEMHTKMMPDRSYHTFIRDMTERKRIEDALLASEKKFSEAFRTSPDSININRTSDGVYLEVNKGFTQITGYTAKEVLGKSSLDPSIQIWHDPADREKMIRLLAKKEEVTGFEAPFRMKDGTLRHGLMSARLIEINGESCIISTTRDITERKLIEQNLLESEQSFRGILNTVSESIYILNNEGKFIDVNEGALKMYGYERTDFIDSGIEFVSADGKNNLPAITAAVFQTLKDGTPLHFEFWGKRKNGEIFLKDVICNRGKFFGKDVIIATGRDITERKNNENVLLAAKKKAEESERLKSAFLANMSHEIRSPMNSIVGFSELIEDEDLPADQRHEFIAIIRNSGRQLLTIINDIIDFAKIDSNQLAISPSEINLNRILDDIRLSAEVDKRNLHKNEVELLIEKGLPNENCTLICDEVRLKQILLNLTGNALKFTNKGYIKTGYRLEGESIVFYVEDTGKGIAKDKQDVIFERFRQEEESYTRLYGGTGLGLSISKGLVELLGGKIWLKSELGKGSTFFFNLPATMWSGFAKSEEIPVADASVPDLNGKTILVAEDIESNFRLINHMLKKTKARVLYAEDGLIAVDICRQDKNIDLILMDIQMPVMNGIEATIEIKKFMPQVPVIALTAFSLSEDSDHCLEAGCVDYLTKPIEKASMLEKVKAYI